MPGNKKMNICLRENEVSLTLSFLYVLIS